MRWLRSHVRFGSWCALFALAVQVAVSFGHAHRADFGWPSGFLPASGLITEQPAASPPTVPSALTKSAPTKPAGLAFDYCAICAVMNLAAAAVPASAPGLPVPIIVGASRGWTVPDISPAELPHLLFQARAPPIA
jgi:hypothetical protein